MVLAASTIEGELLVVECDEAAAVVRFLQNITLQYSTIQYSTVQVSAEHHTAVPTTSHSTVQYSTVQYSSVQYSTHCSGHNITQLQTIVTTLKFYTENELCQASLYEDSPLLKYHNTFGGNIPGIL